MSLTVASCTVRRISMRRAQYPYTIARNNMALFELSTACAREPADVDARKTGIRTIL